MFPLLKSLMRQVRPKSPDRGASAVEYGLLIAGIAALIVVAVFALGPVVKGAFEETCSNIVASDASDANDGSC